MRSLAHSDDDAHGSRHLAPDLMRGAGNLLIVLTNVPLILTTIRYKQAASENLFSGSALDDVAVFLFLAVPAMAGMGAFVLAMGYGLSEAGSSPQEYRKALQRLFVIGVLGLLHGLGVWWGDVLFYYMIAGLLALHFRQRTPQQQVVIGASVAMLPATLTVAELLAQVGGVSSSIRATIANYTSHYGGLEERAQAAYSSRDIRMILIQRASDWLDYMQDFALIGVCQLTGLILIGIGIARLRKIGDFESWVRARSTLVTVVSAAVSAGYLLQLGIQVFAPSDVGVLNSIAGVFQVCCPPMLAVLLYLGVIVNEEKLSKVTFVRALAASGRYSLSIYLTTSLLFAAVAYGFGDFGEVRFLVVQGAAVGAFVILVALSVALDRHRLRGPAEWLLRSLIRTSQTRHHADIQEVRDVNP